MSLPELGYCIEVLGRKWEEPGFWRFRADLVWPAEGARSHEDRKAEYARMGRLLLKAGSPVEWRSGQEPAEAIPEIIDEWRTRPERTA